MSNAMWRNSASLILAVKNSKPAKSRFDYNILMLKRSSKSSFMPRAYVFPGGITEKSDFCPTWTDLLAPVKPLEPLVLSGAPRPVIMKKDPGLLEPDIGFRINAIRETFEETGILLHLATDGPMPSEELAKWRSLVHADASKFKEMCLSLKIVPDVWSLFEWSDWLVIF